MSQVVETGRLTLEKRLRMYQARDAIIDRLNPEASQLIDLDKFLRAATDELGKLMEVDRCHLVARSQAGELRIEYEYRADPDIPSMLGMKIPVDLSALEGRVDLTRPIAIDDTASLRLDPVLARIVELTQTRSLLIVPVVRKSEVLGLIGLHHCRRQHQWLPEEISFIESIARQVAIGYEYTRLYMEKEKEATITRALLEIANEINRSGDLLEVAALVMDRALELVGADVGGLAVLDAAGVRLGLDTVRGRAAHMLSVTEIALERYPVLQRAFAERRACRVEATESDAARAFLHDVLGGAQLALLVPILIKDRAFGALLLAWQSPAVRVTVHEIGLVEGIANQIALALEKDQLSAEVVRLRQELRGAQATLPIIGVSDKIKRCIEMALHVADSSTTVLLQGESGVGKELIADLIHYNSRRADKPFVKINCGALPEALLETELFGHERGAFTDARARRIGKFEEANGGTLFLDEIGELSPSAQVKLLRVLQDGEFTRIGGNQVIKTDVRIIAATNVDLQKAVEAGRFRLDLFYRLNVYPIYIPPLRERREDIRPLVIHFIKLYQKKSGKRVTGITQKALELLESYDWPGNVRELENAIERAVILAAGRMITVNDLPAAVRRGVGATSGESEIGAPMEEVERRILLESLMPPLRERPEYIYPLALHFLELYRHKYARPRLELSEPVLERLRRYPWSGGIRELEAVIEQAVARTNGPVITVESLPEPLRNLPVSEEANDRPIPPVVEIPIGTPLEEAERRLILRTLDFTGGHKSRTAELLKIGRKTLYRKLAQYRQKGSQGEVTEAASNRSDR
ncbi:MAG: sigma 54-interacting transcriptional regulator [Blastocatellia bacterium]|nr:sigma 54-interacting transcriptional regulator [Blastocatellia bacterium]MCS7156754.1 sigma 54-interacting transcriptional regulator [Blastocatellia bacterium]MCX7751504.1 sigma 54-interacting transcriptional regulator [Blastocatellia bacterium]MDW8168604.1 sigma 54-interacting transcriptional regulator [Acidobacteriota bacterium]MDW8256569.1 sigma 54-interacting transcriptional regulator [Acidobacteriota bacterium]